MVHGGCVFVAGIHPSRTWMSRSFESMGGNACMHRLDFGLYSHPKEVWGMESEPMLTPREKSAMLHHAGQVQHTTNWAIQTPYILSSSSLLTISHTLLLISSSPWHAGTFNISSQLSFFLSRVLWPCTKYANSVRAISCGLVEFVEYQGKLSLE